MPDHPNESILVRVTDGGLLVGTREFTRCERIAQSQPDAATKRAMLVALAGQVKRQSVEVSDA